MRFSIVVLLIIGLISVYGSDRRNRGPGRGRGLHSKTKYTSRFQPYEQSRRRDRSRNRHGTSSRGSRGTGTTRGQGTRAQHTTRGRGRGRGQRQTEDVRRWYNLGDPKYRCSPQSGQDPDGPVHKWLHREMTNVDVVHNDPSPPPNHIHYEAAVYPRIQANPGYLPPQDIPTTVFYIYLVQMTLSGPNTPSLDMVRLPYEYGSLAREECQVYTEPEFYAEPFFVLENLGPKNDSYLVRISKNDAGNEYVNLPYYNAAGVLFLRRTWIVRTYQEQEENEPHPEYGYLSITEAVFDQNRLPLNAFQLGIHNKPRLRETQLIPQRATSNVKLAISWLPSLCMKQLIFGVWRLHDVCYNGDWSIHGLWIDDMHERQVHSDLHFRWLTEAIDYELEENIRVTWGLVQAKPVQQAMSFKYNKHGRHLYDSSMKFFTETKKLFAKVLAKLKKGRVDKLANDVETVRFSRIQERVESKFEEKVQYVCHFLGGGTQFSLLVDIRFCFSKNGDEFTPQNCPVDETVNPCQKRVYFPEHYQLFPYVYQSIYWFPSMVARLSTYSGFDRHGTSRVNPATMNYDHKDFKNYFPQWKFRGLCPMTYTPYLVRYYGEHFNFYDYQFPIAAAYEKFHEKSPHIVNLGTYGYLRYKLCGRPLRLARVMKVKGTWGYFRTSEELFDGLRTYRLPPIGQYRYEGDRTQQADEEASDFEMDKRLRVSKVHRRIKKLVGNNVFMECFTNEKGAKILLKILVCYGVEDENFAQIDCPDVRAMYRQKGYSQFPPEMKKRDEWSSSDVDCGDGELYIPSGKQNVLTMGEP